MVLPVSAAQLCRRIVLGFDVHGHVIDVQDQWDGHVYLQHITTATPQETDKFLVIRVTDDVQQPVYRAVVALPAVAAGQRRLREQRRRLRGGKSHPSLTTTHSTNNDHKTNTETMSSLETNQAPDKHRQCLNIDMTDSERSQEASPRSSGFR